MVKRPITIQTLAHLKLKIASYIKISPYPIKKIVIISEIMATQYIG